MRKVLSIVLALLMVSMMIPSMAFAADDLSATGVPAVALVAGQSFDLTITSASANVTVKVNTNVFDLPGTEETAGKIGYISCAPGTITITVKTDIPTEEFTSSIRIEDEDDAISVPVKVDDRVFGDVNGKDGITTYDAAQVLAYAVGAVSSVAADTFNVAVANVNGDVNESGVDVVTTYDAAQILAYAVGANSSVSESTNAIINKYANGNSFDVVVTVTDEFKDPTSWETTTEPEIPAEKTALATPANVYGYYVEADSLIYYTFDLVDNAAAYEIYINGELATTVEVAKNSGSFEAPASVTADALGTIAVKAIAAADSETYKDSEMSTAVNIAKGDASGALAAWLEKNGLEDVVITVYEITADAE